MATFVWDLSPSAPSSPSPGPADLSGVLFGLFDQVVDPNTRDYVDTSEGAWAETESSRTAVMLQLEIRYGEWFVDPLAGSRIPAMLESGEPVSPEEVVDETRRALQVLVDDGIISELSVALGDFDLAAGSMDLELSYTDMSSGHVVDLIYSPL